MILADIPTTAVLVSPGVWTDAPTCQKFYLDPLDPTLVVARLWTEDERATWQTAQDQAAEAEAQLRQAIAARVQELREAVTAATDFQTAETTLAATIASIPPASITTEQIRDQVALLHTNDAVVTGRLILALNAVADLADLVASSVVDDITAAR